MLSSTPVTAGIASTTAVETSPLVPPAAMWQNRPMATRRIRNRPLKEKHLLPQWLADARAGRPDAAAFCRHAEHCGGCDLQEHPYDEQLAIKGALWRRVIEHFDADAWLGGIEPTIIPSPKQTRYRQRMDYTVAFGKCGLRQAGDWRTLIDLQECHLLPERGFAAMRRAVELGDEFGLKHYNFITQKGFWRYCSLRCTSLDQVMLCLTTAHRDHARGVERTAQALLDEGLVDSVHWLVNESKSDRAGGEPETHWGQEFIEERILDKIFPIGPASFFQANQAVTEQAYARLRDWLRATSPRCGLDLYAGIGTIASLLADCCQRVIAVENDPANLALFRQACDRNGIANVELVASGVEEWLLAGDLPDIDALVINPPRIGLRERGSHVVRDLGAGRLGYMSCNPLSLVRDLDILRQAYEIVSVNIFDMFPQTRHFETVVLLERR